MEVVLRCATGWLLVPLIPDQDKSSPAVCSPRISFDSTHAVRVCVDAVVLWLRSDLRLRPANGERKIRQKGDLPVG